MSSACTGHGVTVFVLLSMKTRMRLEMLGMKGPGESMFSKIKKLYGFKGNRQQVYNQFCEYVEKEKEKLKPGEIVTVK